MFWFSYWRPQPSQFGLSIALGQLFPVPLLCQVNALSFRSHGLVKSNRCDCFQPVLGSISKSFNSRSPTQSRLMMVCPVQVSVGYQPNLTSASWLRFVCASRLGNQRNRLSSYTQSAYGKERVPFVSTPQSSR